MKKLLTTLAAAVGIAYSSYAQHINLLSPGSATFTVDPGATTAAYTQSASGIIFNGTYALGDTLGGTFATEDWSNPLYTEFGVVMTLTGVNPNLSFSVLFYDASFNVINAYGGTTVPLVAGTPTYTPLSLNIAGTGILTSVAGIQFTWDGGGAINATVEKVAATAVPAVDNSWTWRAPLPQGNSLTGAAVSSGLPQTIVAVGEVGTVLTSNEGGPWQVSRVSGVGDLFQVLSVGNFFLASALDAMGEPIALRSVDGLNWSPVALPGNFDFANVADVATAAGRLVAITAGGSSLFSLDAATTWAAGGSLGAADNANGWSSYYALETNGDGVWVAAGTGGTVARSVNGGESWTKSSLPNATGFNAYDLQSDGSGFIAIGGIDSNMGYVSRAYSSADGVSWSATLDPAGLGLTDGFIDRVFGIPGMFIAVVSGNKPDTQLGSSWGRFVYTSTNGGQTWDPFELNLPMGLNLSMVQSVVSTTDGTIHMFGHGGLNATLAPGSADLQLASMPYFGGWTPTFFTAAGANGAFVVVDSMGGNTIHSPDGLAFQASGGEYAYDANPTVVSEHVGGFIRARIEYWNEVLQTSGPFVVFETSTDGSTWNPGNTPSLTPVVSSGSYIFLADVAASSAGRVALLSIEDNEQDVAHLHFWNGSQWMKVQGPDLTFPGSSPWDSVRPQVQWDGARFLLLTPKGRLFTSTNGTTWTALPALPADTSAYLAANFEGFSGLDPANSIYAFDSSGNGTIVARPSKSIGGSISSLGPDRFFVLTPGATAWTQCQSPSSSDRYEGSNVVWNGSIFASANNSGLLWTSADGLAWTRRALGADVKVLTWTGQQFVGLTEYSSIITHPTGLSPEAEALLGPIPSPTPTPTPTPSPSPGPDPTPSPSPTASPTPSPSPGPNPTPVPGAGSWTWRAPTLQGNSLLSAVVSSGSQQTIVAVGEAGTVVTKTGAGSWQAAHLEGVGDFFGAYRAGEYFLAAALGADGNPLGLRSMDGLNWTTIALPGDFDFLSVMDVATVGPRLIAITDSGESIITTDAAATWQAGGRLPKADGIDGWSSYFALAANNQGVWVAGGTGGTVALSSNSGLSWDSGDSLPDAARFTTYDIQTDGSGFLAFGYADSDWGFSIPRLYRSNNGSSWSRTLDPASILTDYGISNAYAEKVFGLPGLFVAVLSGTETHDPYSYGSRRTLVLASGDAGQTWSPLPLSPHSVDGFDLSMVTSSAATTDGTIYLFGLGGLIASIVPDDSADLQLISTPYFSAWPPRLFTTAAVNGTFVATTAFRSIHSADGVNFSASTDYPKPGAVTEYGSGFLGARVDWQWNGDLQTSERVVTFDASQDGSSWAAASIPAFNPTTNPYGNPFEIADLEVSHNGRIAVVTIEQSWNPDNYEPIYLLALHLWDGERWTKVQGLDSEVPSPWGHNTSVRPHLQWDGQQFLFLSPHGRLFRSLHGLDWLPLPALPSDSAAYLTANFSDYGPVVPGNRVHSFASNGTGTVVARSCKLVNESFLDLGPDRFFVLAPGASEWSQVQPGSAAMGRFEGNHVIWNGSIFASANAAGALWTSPDGLSWTRRALGADVKVLTWTGQQFVGLTEYSSILTHPNGLSPEAPGISFRLIKSINGVDLGSTDSGYALRVNGVTTQISNAGTNANASSVPGWTPLGVVEGANSSYTLYWKNATTGQYAVWVLNGQGALTSGRLADVGEVLVAETNLSTDLDGDGQTGLQFGAIPPAQNPREIGNVEMGQTQLGYALRVNGVTTQISNAGTNANASSVPGWTPLGVVDGANGSYTLYWKNATTGQYAVWVLNGQGALTSGRLADVGEVLVAETNLSTDLDGDGQTGLQFTLTRQIGNVELGQTQLGYALQIRRVITQITNAGANASASSVPGWTPLGVVAEANSTYTLYWRNASSGQYAVWALNAQGAVTAGRLASVGDILVAETNTNTDLDGDGQTGLQFGAIPPAQSVRTIGNVSLGQTQLGYALRVNGVITQITNAGANANASTVPGWTPLGVVDGANGSYTLYWKNATTGQYAVWVLNGQGALTSGRLADVGEVLVAETNLSTDLDGDGQTGLQFTLTRQIGNVEFGSTQLGYAMRVGFSYYPPSPGTLVQISNAGANASASTVPGWTPLGAAAKFASNDYHSGAVSGYSLYWSNPNTGQYAVWDLSAQGVTLSGRVLSLGELVASETVHGADLNSDGELGSVLPGIYVGQFSGDMDNGEIALLVLPDLRAVVLGYNWSKGEGVLASSFSPNLDGSFAGSVYEGGVFNGSIDKLNGSMTGNFSTNFGGFGSFSGSRVADHGRYSASVNGLYTGTFSSYYGTGTVYVILMADGRFFTYFVDPVYGLTSGGSSTVGPGNSVNVSMVDGAIAYGSFDEANKRITGNFWSPSTWGTFQVTRFNP